MNSAILFKGWEKPIVSLFSTTKLDIEEPLQDNKILHKQPKAAKIKRCNLRQATVKIEQIPDICLMSLRLNISLSYKALQIGEKSSGHI